MEHTALIIRLLKEQDYDAFRDLFAHAYAEYLDFLKQEDPELYQQQEQRAVSRDRFNFYLHTGSSYVAESEGHVIGYVASQTEHYVHGQDDLLWIEYIVVHPQYRQQGVGSALLQALKQYAQKHEIDKIFTTINPDNPASLQLHRQAGFVIKDWKIASFIVQ
jgi:ribosomal protein S18 acetylase RimI-like enzyme